MNETHHRKNGRRKPFLPQNKKGEAATSASPSQSVRGNTDHFMVSISMTACWTRRCTIVSRVTF